MALTCVFALCAVLYLVGISRSASVGTRFTGFLHLLMALAMIAMTWSWGMRISTITYVLVFTASALYFAHRALGRSERASTVECPDPAHHNDAYHAAMMASMVVMAVLMSVPGTSATVHQAVGGEMPSMRGMTGMGPMDMSGGSGTPVWSTVVTGVLAVLYVLAALVYFYRSVQGPRRWVVEILMSSGMAVSFALMT